MVFDKDWFKKYQETLLFFLNNWIFRIPFRYILRIVNLSIFEYIEEIAPDHLIIRGKGSFKTARIHSHDKFGKRLYYAFNPIWKLLHAFDMTFTRVYNFGFDSFQIYTEEQNGRKICDGYIRNSSAGTTFSDISTNLISGGVNTSAATLDFAFVTNATNGQYIDLYRPYISFDTSCLGLEATISDCLFSGKGLYKDNGCGSSDLFIVVSTQASAQTLATSDYTSVGSTSFGTVDYDSFLDTDYNDITFNSTGLSNISKTAMTKLSFRFGFEIGIGSPTWGSNKLTGLYMYSSDQTGTSEDPYLTVTFTTTVGTVHEYNVNHDYLTFNLYNNQYLAQTFTTSSEYTMSKVSLLLRKTGTPTGNITVDLKATSSDKPTGASLASTTIDSTTLTTDTYGSWVTVNLSYSLSDATKYAIVLSGNFSGPDNPQWMTSGGNDFEPYTEGNRCYSSDGTNWTQDLLDDNAFIIYSGGSSGDTFIPQIIII